MKDKHCAKWPQLPRKHIPIWITGANWVGRGVVTGGGLDSAEIEDLDWSILLKMILPPSLPTQLSCFCQAIKDPPARSHPFYSFFFNNCPSKGQWPFYLSHFEAHFTSNISPGSLCFCNSSFLPCVWSKMSLTQKPTKICTYLGPDKNEFWAKSMPPPPKRMTSQKTSKKMNGAKISVGAQKNKKSKTVC